MHQASDFDSFRKTLGECATAFSKPEPDEELVRVYWDALKDLAFSTVKAQAQSHLRYGKFFPKPAELRPKEQKAAVRDPLAEAKFQEGERRAIRGLEQISDPVARMEEVKWRYANRILATADPSSPQYAEALTEARRQWPHRVAGR